MAMKDRFSNIFGGGSEDFWTAAPTLSAVLPGMVNTSAQGQFTSAELNRRGEGIRGGRKTRTGRTRSASTFLPRELQEKMQKTTIFEQPSRGRDESPNEPTDFIGGQSPASGTYGGDYRDDGDEQSPYGGAMQRTGENMMGNEVASNIGSSILGTTALGTMGGMAMGGSLGSSLTGALGPSVAGIFGPLGLLNLADTVVGTHQAIGDAKNAAVFEGEPDVQRNVMQGVFNSQPKTFSGRLASQFGLGDPGIQSHEANLAGDSPSQFGYDRPDIDPSTQPDWSEQIDDVYSPASPEQLIDQTFGNPMDTLADTVNKQTRQELDTNTAEFQAPSFLENLGINFQPPDEKAMAGAGVEITESGAFDKGKGGFEDINNVSGDYEQTGLDVTGDPTFGPASTGVDVENTRVASDLPTSQPTADPAIAAKAEADAAAAAESDRIAAAQSTYDTEKAKMDLTNSKLSSKTIDQQGYTRLSPAGKKALEELVAAGVIQPGGGTGGSSGNVYQYNSQSSGGEGGGGSVAGGVSGDRDSVSSGRGGRGGMTM